MNVRILTFTLLAALFLAAGTSVSYASMDRSKKTEKSYSSAADDDGPREVATISLPPKMTLDKTQKIIMRAAVARKWTIVEQKPASVRINLIHRGYDANLTFNYDSKKITIISDSWTITRSGERKKRKDPTGWIENLEKDIKVFITREQYL